MLKDVVWSVVVVSGMMLSAFLPGVVAQLPDPSTQQFLPVSLGPPPSFTGVLSPNNALTKVAKLGENAVLGPHSIVVAGDLVYTSLANGLVVVLVPPRYTTVHSSRKIRPPDKSFGCTPNLYQNAALPSNLGQDACGRPLGIRALDSNVLLVAVPDKGIYKWNSSNNVYEWLVDGRQMVDGAPIGFVNDVVTGPDGAVYFTSSSSSLYRHSQAFNVFLSGEKSGRVLMYRGGPLVSKGGSVSVIIRNISMPTGLEIAPDGTYLLVAEGGRARIHRAWIGTNAGTKFGNLEVFADRLPGFPDKIRRSPRGTFWVAFFSVRSAERPSVLDRYNAEQRRQLKSRMSEEQLQRLLPDYGLALELDVSGRTLRSLHDPTGRVFPSLSQVTEVNGTLYIASSRTKYIGTLSLTAIDTTSAGSSVAPEAVSPPLPTYNAALDWLGRVAVSTGPMSRERLQEVVGLLFLRYMETRVDAQQATERANRLQGQLNALRGLPAEADVTGGVGAAIFGANFSDLSLLWTAMP